MSQATSKRLYRKQARDAFLVALCMGLVMSSVIIVRDLLSVRREVRETTLQVMASVRDSAAQAAYTLDTELAGKVIQGLMEFRLIARAEIIDDYGQTLAERERSLTNGRLNTLNDVLLGPELRCELPLEDARFQRPVGLMVTVVDRGLAVSSFVSRSLLTIGWAVFGSLILATILAALFYRRLTAPLTDLVRRIAAVPPDNPGAGILPIPEGHEQDELGQLVQTANSLLRQLDDSMLSIRQAEERYRSIFENAVEGIFQSTPDGRILGASPSMAAILGYDSPQDLMDSLSDLARQMYVIPENRAEYKRILEERGRITGFETMLYRKDGTICWVSISARCVRDARGEPAWYEGFMLDITQRKEAQEELDQMNRHLESLVEERTEELAQRARELEILNARLVEMDNIKSDFLSSVSHELRTPLTSILGFSKLISKSMASIGSEENLERKVERALSNLGIIIQEGERLTRMVDDFLDLSKIEAGRLAWNDQPVTSRDIATRAAEAAAGAFAEKPGVELRLELGEEQPLLVDPDRLLQVLINLLNNAAKFTPTGEVVLRVLPGAGGRVRFEVQDTGVGILPEELGKIFDKFHQVRQKDTLQDKPRGTGLGLAICRQIVEHYGGKLQAVSEPGRGSTFFFELRSAVCIPLDLEAEEAVGEDKRPLILVVDDEQAISSLLRQILEAEGYRVLTAGDGQTALELARRYSPDLITMDLLMPVMDGREAIARLRSDPELRGIPILVITMVQDSEPAGEDQLLCKPLDEGKLLDAVNSLLGRCKGNARMLALRRNGPEGMGRLFALSTERIQHVAENELLERIEKGFRGVVILPPWADREALIPRIGDREGVSVVILPEVE